MFDWILEADIHRLRKAAAEATYPDQRRELLTLLNQKIAVLDEQRSRSRATQETSELSS